jgi:Tfp pilus assembly protein PilO
VRQGAVWREHAIFLGIAAVFLLANVVFLAADRAIEGARVRALESTKDELTGRVEATEKQARQSVLVRSRLTEVHDALETFYSKKVGPQDDRLPEIVAEIHRITRGVGLVPHQIGYGYAPVTKLGLIRMTVSFSVTGDYATVRRLIHAFETDRQWIALTQMALAEEGGGSGQTIIRLTAATYFSAPAQNGRPARAS